MFHYLIKELCLLILWDLAIFSQLLNLRNNSIVIIYLFYFQICKILFILSFRTNSLINYLHFLKDLLQASYQLTLLLETIVCLLELLFMYHVIFIYIIFILYLYFIYIIFILYHIYLNLFYLNLFIFILIKNGIFDVFQYFEDKKNEDYLVFGDLSQEDIFNEYLNYNNLGSEF